MNVKLANVIFLFNSFCGWCWRNLEWTETSRTNPSLLNLSGQLEMAEISTLNSLRSISKNFGLNCFQPAGIWPELPVCLCEKGAALWPGFSGDINRKPLQIWWNGTWLQPWRWLQCGHFYQNCEKRRETAVPWTVGQLAKKLFPWLLFVTKMLQIIS